MLDLLVTYLTCWKTLCFVSCLAFPAYQKANTVFQKSGLLLQIGWNGTLTNWRHFPSATTTTTTNDVKCKSGGILVHHRTFSTPFPRETARLSYFCPGAFSRSVAKGKSTGSPGSVLLWIKELTVHIDGGTEIQAVWWVDNRIRLGPGNSTWL